MPVGPVARQPSHESERTAVRSIQGAAAGGHHWAAMRSRISGKGKGGVWGGMGWRAAADLASYELADPLDDLGDADVALLEIL